MNQEESFLNLENYILLNKIGEGGFGEVYIVIKKDENIKYVAKVSKTQLNEYDEEFKLSLKREVNLLAQIKHPFVLRFIGYSPIDFLHRNRPVIITEYLPNGSLYDIVKREKNGCILESWTPTKKIINIFGIASIMSYLHKYNIIHRDLKLDNVLIDDYLFPKIADFGLAKIVHKHKRTMTEKSAPGIKGTIAYTAPEILKDPSNYTLACDVYSFAFIIYEIFNPTFPYEKMKLYEIIDNVTKGKRPVIDENVPKCYKELIEDCWKQNPRRRPTFNNIVKRLKTEKEFRVGIDSKEFDAFIDLIENCSNENLDLSKFTKIKICPDNFSFSHASDELFNKLQKDIKDIILKAKSSIEKFYTFSDDECLKLFAFKTFDSKFFQAILKNFSNVTFEFNSSNNIIVLSPILQKLSNLYENDFKMLRVNLSVNDISHLSDIVGNKSVPISIKIDESVISFPPNAFCKCSSVYEIDIPSSITSIGDNAFCDCSSLEQITIPSSVIRIGDKAFCGCCLLEQIIVPSSVTEIGKGIFEGCKMLEFAEIQTKMEEIKENTFKGCQSLNNVVLPDSVVKIGKHAFEGCKSFEGFKDEFLERIESIEEHAFEGCENISRFLITSKISIINEGVFIGCSKLNEITIPKTITSIEPDSFKSCKNLKKITFENPSSLISIKDRSFQNCTSLNEITIPQTVTIIGSKAFKNCTSLETISFPFSVDEIGASALNGCQNLKEIEMNAPISKVSDKLCKGCVSLTEISIPDTVTEIGIESFCQCVELKKVITPRNLLKIGERAFFGCKLLDKVSIPKSLQLIGKDAFARCSSLLDFDIQPKNI